MGLRILTYCRPSYPLNVGYLIDISRIDSKDVDRVHSVTLYNVLFVASVFFFFVCFTLL